MSIPDKSVVLIVGYRNAADIAGCLRALATSQEEPHFEVFICENGGDDAYDKLIDALAEETCFCTALDAKDTLEAPLFMRRCLLELSPRGSGRRVHVGEARENLGYAGGINAWLRPLMDEAGWSAAWILNPDTLPMPTALMELAAYSSRRGKGMVGSRSLAQAYPKRIDNRGLAWRKFRAATLAVDFHSSASAEPDLDRVEACIDAPVGASMYVTRKCIEAIGLMPEEYFLYFEDLEWGLRAKSACGVGYAHRSVVTHVGGTTIGGAGRRADHSALAVYLNFRNRILFVRRNFRRWLPWTVIMQVVDAMRYALTWPPKNLWPAFQGIAAGIAGETGRPDHLLRRHGQRRGQGARQPPRVPSPQR